MHIQISKVQHTENNTYNVEVTTFNRFVNILHIYKERERVGAKRNYTHRSIHFQQYLASLHVIMQYGKHDCLHDMLNVHIYHRPTTNT